MIPKRIELIVKQTPVLFNSKNYWLQLRLKRYTHFFVNELIFWLKLVKLVVQRSAVNFTLLLQIRINVARARRVNFVANNSLAIVS